MPAPRSLAARRAVLDAAWDLFAERGLPGVSVEGIAARAGVGKTTVYRWWPSKASVLMDALLDRHDEQVAFPTGGPAREAVRRQLRSVQDLFATPPGRAYLALVAESQHDADLARDLRERYIASRRATAIAVLDRGRNQGELASATDLEVLVDALYGALYYRALVAHAEPSGDDGYVDRLLDTVWPVPPIAART